MGDVHILNMVTRMDIPVDRVIDSIPRDMAEIVVVGYTAEGGSISHRTRPAAPMCSGCFRWPPRSSSRLDNERASGRSVGRAAHAVAVGVTVRRGHRRRLGLDHMGGRSGLARLDHALG